MTLKLRHVLLFTALGAALTLFVLPSLVGAYVRSEVPTVKDVQNFYTFFATSSTDTVLATTTSATSTDNASFVDANGKIDNGTVSLAGADKATFYFGRSGSPANTGKTIFKVEVTPDGTTWYQFNRLLIEDGSNTATTTYTISAATSTARVSLDLDSHTFRAARCVVTETTDGTHTCSVSVEY